MPANHLSSSEVPSPLPRSVWILSWVSFFADVSGEMMYPLLPLFLVTVLGSSKTQLGAMEGGAVLIVAMMSAFAGLRSDRKGPGGGRVLWIRWGYGLPVLGKAIVATATVWPLVLIGRLLDRFGKGLRGAPRDALIADAVNEDQRGRAFGLHRAFDTAGALVGVLLAAFLLWWLTGTPQVADTNDTMHSSIETPAWVYRAIFARSRPAYYGSRHWTRRSRAQLELTSFCEVERCSAAVDLRTRHLHYDALGEEQAGRDLITLCDG